MQLVAFGLLVVVLHLMTIVAVHRAEFVSFKNSVPKRTMTERTMVGVSGKIGSGKSTLALALQAANAGTTEICNFADALKREVAQKYNVPLERFNSQEEKNKPVGDGTLTLGGALQQVGAARRAENPDYWLERLDEHLATLDPAVTLVVVGDVRHVNEAGWVTRRGGLLVRLNGDPGGTRAASTRDHTHPSETDLDSYTDFDLVFNTEQSDSDAMAKAILDWTAIDESE